MPLLVGILEQGDQGKELGGAIPTRRAPTNPDDPVTRIVEPGAGVVFVAWFVCHCKG